LQFDHNMTQVLNNTHVNTIVTPFSRESLASALNKKITVVKSLIEGERKQYIELIEGNIKQHMTDTYVQLSTVRGKGSKNKSVNILHNSLFVLNDMYEDTASKVLQKMKDVSANVVGQIKKVTEETLNALHEQYEIFWTDVGSAEKKAF